MINKIEPSKDLETRVTNLEESLQKLILALNNQIKSRNCKVDGHKFVIIITYERNFYDTIVSQCQHCGQLQKTDV